MPHATFAAKKKTKKSGSVDVRTGASLAPIPTDREELFQLG
jgi:hypothetical protein